MFFRTAYCMCTSGNGIVQTAGYKCVQPSWISWVLLDKWYFKKQKGENGVKKYMAVLSRATFTQLSILHILLKQSVSDP